MKAIELFSGQYNCAQSVLLSFSDMLGANPAILEKIALGFGGGMGRLQKTCGAVTGAFMVISLYTANSTKNEEERTALVRSRIKEFHQRFIAIHDKSDCCDLLGYDVNSEEGRHKIEQENLKEKICMPCVQDAVEILEQLIT